MGWSGGLLDNVAVEGNGFESQGPGMLGKNLIFYIGNGALWKTTAGEGQEASRGRTAPEACRGTGVG